MLCPCENCLVFVMCKRKLFGYETHVRAVTDLAEYSNCDRLRNYLVCGDIKDIDYCRHLYGLQPINVLLLREDNP